MQSVVTLQINATSGDGFRGRSNLPYTRWLLLLALLIAELLGVTLWFDTGALASQHTRWAGFVGHWPLANQLLIAAAAATLVFGGTRIRDELLSVADQLNISPRAWLWLPIHIVSLVATSLIAGHVLDGGISHSAWPWLWIMLWIGMTLITLGLLLPVAIPPPLWPSLLRRALPTMLLGLAVGAVAWGAGYLTSSLWKPLSNVTLRLVAAILARIVADPYCLPDQFIVGTERFHVHVAPECAGYEGVGLISVFLAVYLFLYRRTLRFPRALLLIPVGAGVIWAANITRIVALIVLGTLVSPVIALESFHSLAGWLSFIGVSLGLVVVTQRSRWFAIASPERLTVNPITPYLGPLVAALAVGMVTGAFFNGYDPLYGLSVVAASVVFWSFRKYYAAWDWSFDWVSVLLGLAAYACWIALIGPTHDAHRAGQLGAAMASLPTWAARVWIVFRVLGAVVTVPLAEELTFRGFLTRRLISSSFDEVPMGKFSWFSFVLSSILFGALHHTVLAGTVAGMFFALALYRRGRLADAVIAHATVNALIAVQVLTTGAWYLWN